MVIKIFGFLNIKGWWINFHHFFFMQKKIENQLYEDKMAEQLTLDKIDTFTGSKNKFANGGLYSTFKRGQNNKPYSRLRKSTCYVGWYLLKNLKIFALYYKLGDDKKTKEYLNKINKANIIF